MVPDLKEIEKLKVPTGVIKDSKKLTALLKEMCYTINTLTRCANIQTRITASELVARPTYVEEFQNIKDKVQMVIKAKIDGADVNNSED